MTYKISNGMKRIIISSLLVLVGVLALGQAAFAGSAVLSVSPAIATSTVGTAFNNSVQIDPVGNKVCVVKGTINLVNLTCQNITLANGVMAQTAPTCSAPSFTLGIPKCATTSQNLFSVSANGTQAGQASLSFTGVKVIGAGTDVAFSSASGTYNIVPIAQIETSQPNPTIIITPQVNQGTLRVITPTQSATLINKTGSSTNSVSTSSTSTATTTGENRSFVSGLTASVLDALGTAANFIGENKVLILSLLVILLVISQIIMWLRIHKKEDRE